VTISERKRGKAWKRFERSLQRQQQPKPSTGGFRKSTSATQPSRVDYSNRTSSVHRRMYARGIKRVGEESNLNKPVESMTFTVMFGEEQKVLFDAHKVSLTKNARGMKSVLCDPGLAPSLGNGLPKFSAVNHHKLKVWAQAVKTYKGHNLLLIDGDTVIVKDPSRMFNAAFDICFTDRDDVGQCINAGVVFVRCDSRTAKFFENWCKIDEEIVKDPKKFSKAQRIIRGQNQASLGLLLTEGDLAKCDIRLAPCELWNSVNDLWKTFNADECAILHVKNGRTNCSFRDYVLGKNRGRRFDINQHRAVLAEWYKYSPKPATSSKPRPLAKPKAKIATAANKKTPVAKTKTAKAAPKKAATKPRRVKRWEELEFQLKHMSPMHGVELGAWKGQNAAELLKRIPGLKLTMLDAWGEGCVDDGSVYCGFTQPEWDEIKATCEEAVRPYKDRVTIHVTHTNNTDIVPGLVDFVFVDADHSYEGCKRDIIAWWPKVRVGGYLCGHDYGMKSNHKFCKPGVTKAVDEFIAETGVEMFQGADATWFVKKTSDDLPKKQQGREPTVVAFHCDNETTAGYYKQCADELTASLDRLRMPHDIVKRVRKDSPAKTERENWLAAAANKIEVIQQAVQKHGKVIYVDCDYLFERKPSIPADCKVAAVEYVTSYKGNLAYTPKWQAGFLYFSDTAESIRILNLWKQAVKKLKDDHIALDKVLMDNQEHVYTLDQAHSWRGSKDTDKIIARAGKRKRTSKVKSRAKLATVFFGAMIPELVYAHKRSIAANIPEADHEIINPEPPQADNFDRPAWALPNHYKLKFWRDLVHANQGKELILLDADTIALKDVRQRFDFDKTFDICFTDGVDELHPINGGVVFVRCNKKSLAFFDKWLEYDDKVFNDKGYFDKAQKVAAGQNQASLGMMLDANDVAGCKVTYAPCETWNSVNPHWPTFIYDDCYILHVKGGTFRDYVLSGKKLRKFKCNKYSNVIAAWNRWCPPGYTRKMRD